MWLVVLAACGRLEFDEVTLDGLTGDGPSSVPLPASCATLPMNPANTVVSVTPGMIANLPAVMASLQPRTTLVFSPGDYDLSSVGPLVVTASDVTLRSASGDPADVSVRGNLGKPLVIVRADRVVITGMSLRRGDSAIVLGDTAPASDVTLYKLAVSESRGAAIVAPGTSTYADRVTLACSTIAFGDAGRTALAAGGFPCDAMGLHVVSGRTWRVYDTTFDDFSCTSGEAVAVWFHGRSFDVEIARDRIRNSHVGLRIGIATEPTNRRYDDEPSCAVAQASIAAMHVRAFNNIIYEDGRATPYFDSAIAVWNACDIDLNHNTLSIASVEVFSAIESRFAASTELRIRNNALTDVAPAGGVTLRLRDGAPAATTRGNVIGDLTTLFTDATAEQLAPASTSPLRDAADCSGQPIGCDADYFSRQRGQPADVGAIEVP